MARLGSSSVRVSALGLGTAPIGGLYEPVDPDEATAVVRHALGNEISYLDTAPLYGHGVAERRLGLALAGRARSEFVISTKVGRLLRRDVDARSSRLYDPSLFPGAPELRPVFDFSYDAAMTSLDESLGRLELERIDIALIHDPEDHVEDALAGAYRALAALKDQGALGAIGVGTTDVKTLLRLSAEADFDCFLVAGRYTLLNQSALDALLPRCIERNISIILGGIYNSGILANPTINDRYDYAVADGPTRARVRRLETLCARYEVPLAAVALQFSLAHPAVVSGVVGVRSVTELDQLLASAALTIPHALWDELRTTGLIRDDAPIPPGDRSRSTVVNTTAGGSE